MKTLFPANARGHTDLGWLDSHHTFSFGGWYSPEHMGFRSLRVINEDRVAAGQGFGSHPHRDMEILSWVVDGQLGHKDSMGTGSVIRPGELQRMSAGTGVVHSEMNPSRTEPVHFLQIWILPERAGLAPSYEQKAFSLTEGQGRLHLIAARHPTDGALTVHQDMSLYAGKLGTRQSVEHALAPGRHGWVQLVRGELDVGGQTMKAGDGLALSQESMISVLARAPAEFLVFDLA
jgi:quercetin 2,3-dioxygenase